MYLAVEKLTVHYFPWKPLDISLVQKLENAGWMSSQIKIWLINVWVNLIKLLAVHSRTPTDFINIQKFKANLIVDFPSSFIWPWIRTGFILTLPHCLQICGQWRNWTKLQFFQFTFFYTERPMIQILKTTKPLIYMQILFGFETGSIHYFHKFEMLLKRRSRFFDILYRINFLLNYPSNFYTLIPLQHTLKI